MSAGLKGGLSGLGVVLLIVAVVRLFVSHTGSEVLAILVITAVLLLVWRVLTLVWRMLRRRHGPQEVRYQLEAQDIQGLRAASERDSARRRARQGDESGSSWV
ncbi:hypothetical protein [Mycobacterium sp.]|jgi:membrane protein implicated in regulation of membrane protease activity|uniref:hypothetical protein n=1 Tax=Mycobacterium sp. TaxID=1785 RepID=UPI00334175E1|nr:hypothetical protein [Mycobacterium sp.]